MCPTSSGLKIIVGQHIPLSIKVSYGRKREVGIYKQACWDFCGSGAIKKLLYLLLVSALSVVQLLIGGQGLKYKKILYKSFLQPSKAAWWAVQRLCMCSRMYIVLIS